MGISMEAANALESAIDGKIAKASAKSTRANGTVTRIGKDGTPYVRLDGSDTDTPAARAAAAVRVGERVGVTVSGGSMAIDGNWSAPATDDTAANAAQSTADAAIRDAGVAASAAAAAVQSAEVAEQAAQDAQDSLMSVVQGATTVEKAVSVMQTALEAVVDYDPTTDTTQEWFWHDADGAHVLGDTSGYRNDIDSTGMDIKQVDTERSVAHFGVDGVTVGSGGSSRLDMDDDSVRMVGSANVPLFEIDSEGSNTHVTENSIDTKQMYQKNYFSYENSVDVDVSSAVTGTKIWFDDCGMLLRLARKAEYFVICSDTDATYTGSSVRVYKATAADPPSIICLTYEDLRFDQSTGHFTAGTSGEISCSVEGVAYTIRENKPGQQLITTGTFDYSFTVSYDGDSAVTFTHAFTMIDDQAGTIPPGHPSEEAAIRGFDFYTFFPTVVYYVGFGAPIYTLGTRSPDAAKGDFSATIGEGLAAASDNQIALGMYNVADSDGEYAAIIGNGTDDANRSNALAVKWDGEIIASTPVPVASGGTGISDFGTVVSDEHATVSVQSGSYTQLASVSLAAGKWLIIAGCYAAQNANGNRSFTVTNASSTTGVALGRSIAMPGGSSAIYETLTTLVQPTSASTYRVFGYQSRARISTCACSCTR